MPPSPVVGQEPKCLGGHGWPREAALRAPASPASGRGECFYPSDASGRGAQKLANKRQSTHPMQFVARARPFLEFEVLCMFIHFRLDLLQLRGELVRR